MPIKKKSDTVNTNGGANVNGDIRLKGSSTFVGRDQNSGISNKAKSEYIVPIIVALIAVLGTIIVAVINYRTEIDKNQLQSELTQTAQAILVSPLILPTHAPLPSNLPSYLTPTILPIPTP